MEQTITKIISYDLPKTKRSGACKVSKEERPLAVFVDARAFHKWQISASLEGLHLKVVAIPHARWIS